MGLKAKLVLPIVILAAMLGLVDGSYASPVSPAPKKVKNGIVTGNVMMPNGASMSGGQVIFFDAAAGPQPEPGKYERTPEFVRDIEEKGHFRVEVPSGKYYIGVVKRQSGETVGPPVEGDYVWRSLDKKGRPRAYRIGAGRLLNMGIIKVGPLKAEDNVVKEAGTVIEGRVIDPDGNPVADAVVVAFINPSVKSKPLFISTKTGQDGRYLLRVTAGTYYVRARNQFASGPPEPGQIVGYYGEGNPEAITVKPGEKLKNMDFKVILFPGRGPFSEPRPQ